MKYLFPNWNVRSHWPIGPKLAPLADVTLCVCTFDNLGFWGGDLKIFSKRTDIFAPVSSNAVVVKFWSVTWYVAHFPCREALTCSSQSTGGNFKPENWSNSFIRSSSSVALLIGSWLAG